ncbi:MAG: hypothetical protein QOK48_927 [Blastocatellia bacterium]|nr:hypothetical protein [Blastocatellia bacterium]
MVKYSDVPEQVEFEIALEHLLEQLRDFCGIQKGPRVRDLTGQPRSIDLSEEVKEIITIDRMHFHPGFENFSINELITEYLEEATGELLSPGFSI